jgi:hypothetical protein
MNTFNRTILAGLAAAATAAQPALAGESKVQTAQNKAVAEIPHCVTKIGTVSIMDGDDPSGWTQFNLAPPQKLLKVIVQRSGCFNLVDRGLGLDAAQKERDIGGGLGLQRGSNVGQGQIKAADYVLVAEVAAKNGNSAGGAIAGIAGGMIGGTAGALLGGIRTKKLEANTVLSLTNVRTTETVAVEEGYATKTDVSWGAGGGAFFGGFGGAVGGGYEDTDIGRIVTMAFIDAYAKLVTELGGLTPGAAQQAPSKTFTATAPVNMRAGPYACAASIRTLPVGAIVYPTGNKNGLWWEVADENDNVGWVLNTKLAPSQ